MQTYGPESVFSQTLFRPERGWRNITLFTIRLSVSRVLGRGRETAVQPAKEAGEPEDDLWNK